MRLAGACFKEKVCWILMKLFITRSLVQTGLTKTRTPAMHMVLFVGMWLHKACRKYTRMEESSEKGNEWIMWRIELL